MKDSTYSHTSLLGENAYGTKQWVYMISLSVLCHGLLFIGMLGLQHYQPERKNTPAVIDVNLVALPELSPKTKAQQVKPAQPSTKETKSDDKPIVKKTPPKKDAVSIKTPKKAPVIKEKPKPKKPAPVAKEKHSLKQKTFKSSKVVQNAIAQIEEQVEENTPNPLQESMERLKRQVEKIESARQSPETQPDTRKGTASSTTASVSGEKGKKILDQIKLYQIEIAFRVQRNWAFSEQLVSGKSELTAELAFNVLPNGEIKDIWFDKRSGNAYLDESAYKAIVKSNPVDPHPPGINKSRITVGLRFGPEGLR